MAYGIDIFFISNLISIIFVDRLFFLDKLLSFRISMLASMIKNSGWSCFFIGGTQNWVDNFYYMLIFQYGILTYIIIGWIKHIAIKKIDSNYIVLLFTMFLIATMESSLIRPEILVTLIVWKAIFSANEIFENTNEVTRIK